MEKLQRFGVSLPKNLLNRFDSEISRKGYDNRSEALRDLIREYLVKRDIEDDTEVAGTLTIIYDHHVPNLSNKLDEIQHGHHNTVISKLHIHLDHHNCLEAIILRGKRSKIEKLADRIIGTRGVKHGKLTFTSTGKNFLGL